MRSYNAILVREGDDVSKELDTEDELELAALELVSIDTYQCWSIPYGILFSETIPYNGLNRHTPGVDRHLIRIAPYEVRILMQPESVYTPHVPYLQKRRSKKEIHVAKCTSTMEKILTSLPKDTPETSSAPLNRYVKRLVDNGISSEEAKLLTRDISAMMLPKTKKKNT